MKISKCPACGKVPTYVGLTYAMGDKSHSVTCSGLGSHPKIGSGTHRTKGAAIAAWETIVRDVKAKSDRKCVNGNCSIRATCGRYHQAANIFEAQGADGLYDCHSCRKGKCDHHLAKAVQP